MQANANDKDKQATIWRKSLADHLAACRACSKQDGPKAASVVPFRPHHDVPLPFHLSSSAIHCRRYRAHEYFIGGDTTKSWKWISNGDFAGIAYCGKNLPPQLKVAEPLQKDKDGNVVKYRATQKPPGCRRPYGTGPGFCNHEKQVERKSNSCDKTRFIYAMTRFVSGVTKIVTSTTRIASCSTRIVTCSIRFVTVFDTNRNLFDTNRNLCDRNES